jgi:hypothetical protein
VALAAARGEDRDDVRDAGVADVGDRPQLLTDGLERGPLRTGGRGLREAHARESLHGVQSGDGVERDGVAPEVARQRVERFDGVLGEPPVPLRPAGVGVTGQVERGDGVAALPASLAGVWLRYAGSPPAGRCRHHVPVTATDAISSLIGALS